MKHQHLIHEAKLKRLGVTRILYRLYNECIYSRTIPIQFNDINNAEHKKLIKLEGIHFVDNKRRTNNFKSGYQIEWDPLIGFTAYKYFLKRLNLSYPNSTNDLIQHISKFNEFLGENQSYHNGFILIYLSAIRYSIIYANFIYGENVSFIKNDNLNWDKNLLSNILPHTLPYILLKPSEFEVIYDTYFLEMQTNDVKFLNAIDSFFQNQPDLLNKYLEYFKFKGDNYIDIVGRCYSGMYDQDNDIIFTDADENKARLFGLSRLSFKNAKDIKKSYEIASLLLERIPEDCFRVFQNILSSDYVTDDLEDQCLSDIEKTLLGAETNVRKLLHWAMISDNPKITDILINILNIKPSLILNNIDLISYYLNFNNSPKKSRLSLFFQIIEKNPDIEISTFECFIQTLNDEKYSKLLIYFFNNEKNEVIKQVQDILLIKINYNYEFTKKSLSGKTYFDIKYMANKIIAYVHTSKKLASLIFSLLKAENELEKVKNLVVSIFTDYILFNYRTTVEFLEKKSKSNFEIEKNTAHEILQRYKTYWDQFPDVDFIEEMKLPRSKLREFDKLRFKAVESVRSSPAKSSILNIAKGIQLKAGRKFITRQTSGNYSSSSGMTQISTSMELPRGEFIDPIGQHKIFFEAANYKREL